MFKLLCNIASCILSGIGVVFVAFFKVLPIFSKLGNIKEEIIALAIGVPTIIISIAFALPKLAKILKKL